MSWRYRIEHYEKRDNERKQDVVEFMNEYTEEFSDFDLSLEEQANKWFAEEGEKLSGTEAMERYYENLCDELIVALDGENVIGCRFVEFDKDDEYFRERVPEYELGLNLTFALVDKDYRREGVWSKMFEYVEEEILPKYDVNRLYLATSSENKETQKTMEKNNFEEANRIENERGEGIDTIIYYKEVE